MKYEVGDLIIGEVVKVKPFALFLVFDDGVQALLHISEISDNYIRDIEKYGTIGDKLKVKVLVIDPTNGFMRVSYKQVPKDEAYNTHESNKRISLKGDNELFYNLEKKLTDWINRTIEEADRAKEENK